MAIRIPYSAPEATLRVLHLDHSAEPGGAELALVRLARANTTWRSIVATPRTTGASIFSGLADYLQIGPPQMPGASGAGPIKMATFVWQASMASLALSRSDEFQRADVIHANTARSAVYGTLANMRRRKPMVVHVRDLVTKEGMGSLGAQLMHRLVIPRASGVIASSSACLDTVRGSLSDSATAAVIPSPAGIAERGALRVRRRVREVGMVARLADWKGQELLIRAFASVFRGEPVQLRLAGSALFADRDYESHLRRVAAEVIPEQVTFEGHVTDISNFLDEIDIAVQSSIRPEPLGQNVLQYLARGKPLVASGEGGPTEWIADGENGLLFEPRSQHDLAMKLRQLADDYSLRARLAAAAPATPGLLTDAESRIAHFKMFVCSAEQAKTAQGKRRA